MSPRRLGLLLCAVLCAGALTGCAAHDTLSLDPVANAATKTAKTTSSRFLFSASLDAGAMGQFSFHGNGMFDGPTKRGWANMHFTLPLSAQQQLGTPMTMSMTEELYDFGVRTDIEPPSGSMVTDISDLTGSSS